MFHFIPQKDLQTPEESRIQKLSEYFKVMSNIQRKVQPIITACLDGMVKAAETCDPPKVFEYSTKERFQGFIYDETIRVFTTLFYYVRDPLQFRGPLPFLTVILENQPLFH